jgi:hypothetical protein
VPRAIKAAPANPSLPSSPTGRYAAIQRQNLALEMSRIEKPRMKYSKARMEYKNAEIRLCALKQYDDAKNVRR